MGTTSEGTPALPAVAQKAPYAVEVEAGRTYWWCSCGLSKKQPFCDGSHKGTGLAPQSWTAAEDGRAWFCGCKQTGRSPMCDGKHKGL